MTGNKKVSLRGALQLVEKILNRRWRTVSKKMPQSREAGAVLNALWESVRRPNHCEKIENTSFQRK